MFTEGYKLQGGEIINEENSGFIIRRDKRTLETALDESQTRVPIKQLKYRKKQKKLVPQLNINNFHKQVRHIPDTNTTDASEKKTT
ncbi:unnamed protein product, partial [Umbelopsis sp. WA50703]